MAELNRYLDDIEARLDYEQEERIWRDWIEWAERKNGGGPFAPEPRAKRPSRIEWPHALINDALEDDDTHIYRELEGINGALAAGSPYILHMRVNTGVGNMASMCGAKRFMMARDMDMLPNVYALGESATTALLDAPPPPIDAGNFGTIFRIAKRIAEIKREYPAFDRLVRIEQPDMQGPMDNLELLWGSDMFYALYDSPEVVHALLDYITGLMERQLDAWLELFPNERGVTSYFMHVERGGICIRDDSATNLSPEFFEEFVAPYDGRLLNKYGGLIHFCGRGDHFIGKLHKLKGLYGVNMSQPHLNDLPKVLSETADKGVNISINMTTPDIPLADHDARRVTLLK